MILCNSPGVQLHQSSSTDITTCDNKATITIGTAHKEYEGFYTAKLRTRDGVQEHKSFVYIKGKTQDILENILLHSKIFRECLDFEKF